ncbi:hypothetical protein NLU13_9353 [Sarocladium strictum]|uniref:Uncharacterized protein n=1 Tax=Sarocladium strictum TaxID=5046 RepID=A0AA39GC69_SARSR|nr:hypothetical protein NLU13_9353 [Sarocladium strictum]
MSVPLENTRTHERTGRPVYDMAMPFDPNALRHHAEEQGMSRHDAAVFAHLALSKVRIIYQKTGRPVTSAQLAAAMRQHALEELKAAPTEPLKKHKLNICEAMELEVHRASPTFRDPEEEGMVQMEDVDVGGGKRKRLKFNDLALNRYFDGKDPYEPDLSSEMNNLSIAYKGRDILSALCQHTELAVEIGKYLNARDVLNLYSTSRAFRHAIDGHLLSSVRVWIQHRCAEAGRIFPFKLYKRLLVADPMRRTWAGQLRSQTEASCAPEALRVVRCVPGLKYLQLVESRDRYCHEIIAILARNGHRMPSTMHRTLLRLWLLLDVPTSFQRQAFLRNVKLWADGDLYNAQFLFVKLAMHFNDPIYGPNTHELLHLMMGQKGLFPLWQLLMRKRFTRLREILELKVRYDFDVPPDHWGRDYFDQEIHGVPFEDVGRGHLESWGLGEAHLMRPDELIPLEAVTRGLELDKHLMHMVVWGFIDWDTGENLVPTLEEMYISDEEQALSHMDTTHHWKEKHVLKKNFESLSEEEQQKIIDDDEDDRLRAMACLDDEIHRGFIVSDTKRDTFLTHFPVPGTSGQDIVAWRDFTNAAMVGMPPILDEDEALRAQAYHNYRPEDFGLDDQEWDALEEDVGNLDEATEADDEMEGPEDEDEDEDEDDDAYMEEEDEEEAETIVATGWTLGE